MEWYVIVYLVGLLLFELRLFYKAGIAFGQAPTDHEKEDLVTPTIFSAIALLFWPLLVVIGIVVSPFAILFGYGAKKGKDLKNRKDMWDKIKD